MVKALIFDMDGILIDSMPHHVKTINRVFGAVGIHLDEQTIYDMEGSRTVDIVTYISVSYTHLTLPTIYSV